MLVLSKLTNINHANGGSYDPPLFLYSALFAARGRFGGASPHGGGLWLGFPARRWLWRGFPARRRALAGLSYPAAALAGLPRTAAGFGVASPHGGALAGLPRTAAGFGGLPRTAALWRGFPARRRGLAGLPRPAAGFGGLPRTAAVFGGLPRPAAGFGGLLCTAFSAAAVHSAWGGQFFRCFSHTRPAHGKSIRKNFAGYIAVFHIA